MKLKVRFSPNHFSSLRNYRFCWELLPNPKSHHTVHTSQQQSYLISMTSFNEHGYPRVAEGILCLIQIIFIIFNFFRD